jgi:Kae1-associated kinase Bud32
MQKIAQGAEAVLYMKDNIIIKERLKKSYRISEIDDALRKFRTRREAKFIEKLPVPGPKLISVDDKKMIIEMEFIEGPKVKDVLEKNVNLCFEIGKKAAILHNNNMIHGDLTTSNMILNKKGKKNEVFFIDFGLGFFSYKVEDKAVDLHLLKQALESKHYTVFEKAFKLVLQGYKNESNNYKEILERFEQVEERGRNKHK